MKQQTRQYLVAVLIGFLAGVLLVHPLTMVVGEFFHWHRGYWHFHWGEAVTAIGLSYEIRHLPMAFFYGVLSALVSYFWVRSNSVYWQAAEQSRRFALIGREASTIVHDITNPLFGITAFTELIREGLDDPEKLDYCARIESSAERITNLLAGIKTLAASEGAISVRKEATRLREIAEKVSRDLHLSARLDIDSTADQEIPVDPLYFGRVLSNLFKNADEALAGRSDPVIVVSAHPQDNWWVVEVTDNGPGIPRQIRGKLFTIGITHGKERGTGLGLYSSRRIVEAHGGSISVRHRAAGGTSFLIKLPAA